MNFFAKTVSRSLVWALQSTRPGAHNHSRLLSAQKFMVREMMKISRKPIAVLEDGTKIMEPWIDWQKRSMSKAGEMIIKTQTSVVDLLTLERNNWCDHVAPMGTDSRPQHLL